MTEDKPIDRLIYELKERAKELNCLYRVQELLSDPQASIEQTCSGIVEVIPSGWQYPDICQAMITLGDAVYQSPNLIETQWLQSAGIEVQERIIGNIRVFYTEERPIEDEGPFLKEERKLINTIAEQIGLHILHHQLREVFQDDAKPTAEVKSEWWVILDLLERTDPNLLMRICRKMINYLYWKGVPEAERLLDLFNPSHSEEQGFFHEVNQPFQVQASDTPLSVSEDIFRTASSYLPEEEILDNIHKWIKEDRSCFLVNILVNPSSSLEEISAAIERYHHLASQGLELSTSREEWFRVALIRRILSDHADYIEIAKKFTRVDEFSHFLHRVIYPVGSHGKLGGKSSGLYLAAQILKSSSADDKLLQGVKTPKTWYLTSDGIFYFMSYNNLEDIVEQKYKDVGQVRQEYPYIVNLFKNSPLPPEIIKGLSLALDDFGDVPLIVRSSSLLEDRRGAAFAGKYKSLFVANQGSKEERIVSLMDAISEVYASMFGPDPLEYRNEHGLQDYHEEMGIMIQEVVGNRVGPYFFPVFAGVAFSNNEFRWSSRIKRSDGLIRLVPGLGTRAVDRLSDDYPILITPGQPGLRVNVTIDEIVRYSPKMMDVINLDTGSFETIDIQELLKEYGRDFPNVHQIVSILKQDHIYQPRSKMLNFSQDGFVVSFEGLITRTTFIKQIQSILNLLKQTFNYPVDIEFAHDGENFFLLQCRAQSYDIEGQPPDIPKDVPHERLLFSANRYISNGYVPDISHIVYVDPQGYSELSSPQEMKAIGRAVGRLNQILPKQKFILMGPGRWGSRGDIKLGVSVSYSDINNTAMLIEIARQQKDYMPDPSFGTHFFQDLVEASIRYLPLYPDDSGVLFNDAFFTESRNILTDILPDQANLVDVLKVIDVVDAADGLMLYVLMNAESSHAVALLSDPLAMVVQTPADKAVHSDIIPPEEHWSWRVRSAESIAAALDPHRFGVAGFYIFGSAKNATAGPKSDIDILIHLRGTDEQRAQLLTWLEGWNDSLTYINYQRTGHLVDSLLDVHFVTDEDIQNRTSYAAKIGAVSDSARPLTMGVS